MAVIVADPPVDITPSAIAKDGAPAVIESYASLGDQPVPEAASDVTVFGEEQAMKRMPYDSNVIAVPVVMPVPEDAKRLMTNSPLVGMEPLVPE